MCNGLLARIALLTYLLYPNSPLVHKETAAECGYIVNTPYTQVTSHQGFVRRLNTWLYSYQELSADESEYM